MNNIISEKSWNFISKTTYNGLSQWEQAMYCDMAQNLVFHLDKIRHRTKEMSHLINNSKYYTPRVITFYPIDLISGLSLSTTIEVKLANKDIHPKDYDEIAVHIKVNDVERMVASVYGEDVTYLRSITDFETGKLEFLFRTEMKVFYIYTPPN